MVFGYTSLRDEENAGIISTEHSYLEVGGVYSFHPSTKQGGITRLFLQKTWDEEAVSHEDTTQVKSGHIIRRRALLVVLEQQVRINNILVKTGAGGSLVLSKESWSLDKKRKSSL